MELRFTERAKPERIAYSEWWLAREFPNVRFEMNPNDTLGQFATLVYCGVPHRINLIQEQRHIIAEIDRILRVSALCYDPTPLGAHPEDVTEVGPYFPQVGFWKNVAAARSPHRWAEKYIL